MSEYDNEELLRRTYALAKENNRLLKKIRHGTWFSIIFKILFWAVMLGLPFWLYFNYLGPIVGQGQQIIKSMQSLSGSGSQLQGQTKDIQKLMDMISNLQIGGNINQGLSQ